MQYGYAPGLLWLLIGVCLAGAVQDMLVMAASVRRGGKSLAEIARAELGKSASVIASLAILVIVILALAGLAYVVVKALGGEEAKFPAGTLVRLPTESRVNEPDAGSGEVEFPKGCTLTFPGTGVEQLRSEAFRLKPPVGHTFGQAPPALALLAGGPAIRPLDATAPNDPHTG